METDISYQFINNGHTTMDPILFNDSTYSYIQPTSGRLYKQIVSSTYFVIFLLGVTWNGLVLGIISYYREVRIKSVANYYIWCLSLTDLLFTLSIPFFIYASATSDWIFGGVICKLAIAIRETNRMSSVCILVALSWDRYMASYYDLNHLRTNRVGIIICVVIWCVCGSAAIPYAWSWETEIRGNKTSCNVSWPLKYARIWNYYQLVSGLIVPFVLILTAYVLLRCRLRRLLGPGGPSGIKRPNSKMNRTVIVVVLVFILCNTPYYIVELWSLKHQERVEEFKAKAETYSPTNMEIQLLPYINAVAQILVFVSSCINPVLYGLMNDNYRQLYKNVLCWCQRVSTQRSHPTYQATHRQSQGNRAPEINENNHTINDNLATSPMNAQVISDENSLNPNVGLTSKNKTFVTYKFCVKFHRPGFHKWRKSSAYISKDDGNERR